MTYKIARHRLPYQTPIGGTAILWLLLDRLRPAGWIVGAAWAVWGILFLLTVIGICCEKTFQAMKRLLAKLLGWRCPEWHNVKNDVGYPVLCRCELSEFHEGVHEARVANSLSPLTSTLHFWAGQ